MKNNGSQQKQNFDDLQLFFGFDQRHSFVFTRSERRSRYQDSVHLFGTNLSSLPKVEKPRKGLKDKELSILKSKSELRQKIKNVNFINNAVAKIGVVNFTIDFTRENCWSILSWL